MPAVQVVTPTGPADIEVRDVPEPSPGPHDVLVEVHSVGVSFPDLLLSRGEYQFKPEPPFTLGVDFAGVVLDPGSPESSGFTVGQRVAGVNLHGGAGEQDGGGHAGEGDQQQHRSGEHHDQGQQGRQRRRHDERVARPAAAQHDQHRQRGDDRCELQQGQDRRRAQVEQLGGEAVDLDLDRGDALNGTTPARLLQGPFADAMTHAGQLALLRRLAGSPVPPENFIVANVDPTNLGPDQPSPVSPDRRWPEAPPGWRAGEE